MSYYAYDEELAKRMEELPVVPLKKLVYTYIFICLKRHHWNKTHLCQDLFINLRTLRRKSRIMEKLGYPLKKWPEV